MLKRAKAKEVKPEAVIADSWYSSLDNLKCVRDLRWNWVMGLKKNRVVNRGEKLGDLSIPDDGARIHLRGYGWITVFRFEAKNGRTDYIGTNIENPNREEIKALVRKRWEIEVFHRELKQTCGLEHCQSRTGRAQRNHIALSVLSWIKQADVRRREELSFYEQQWSVIKEAIAKQLKYELTNELIIG
jgi:Transposase DDE domain.